MTTAIDTAEAKGRDKEKIAIAKISISQGLDNKTISTITELSMDEIAKLRL